MTVGAAPVSASSLAGLIPATGAGAPQAGQMIRAVVMAQLQGGLMTLSTASGLIQARADRPLPKGAAVDVTVSQDPDAPGLVFTVRGGAKAAAPALTPGPAPAATAPAEPPPRAQTIAAAGQAAVQRQAGMGPLLADLGQAQAAGALPKAVSEAAAPVLARALPTDRPPAAADIRQAAGASGLFLEQALAQTGRPPAGDLKAALLVLGQVLKAWQAAAPPAAPRPATPSALASLLAPALAAEKAPLDLPETAAPLPAPPYRGGPAAPQGAATPTLPPNAPPLQAAQRLVRQTGDALARQALMQIASLPEAFTEPETTAPGLRAAPTLAGDPSPTQPAAARWHFEIPFATPQGPAVAQFEISRDGQGQGPGGAEGTEPVWRTRFSIDVEPVGPVHVHLALAGEVAHVALWAERPEGLERLRAQAADLTGALAAADCRAEVTFHGGAPAPPPARAGRFVDLSS